MKRITLIIALLAIVTIQTNAQLNIIVDHRSDFTWNEEDSKWDYIDGWETFGHFEFNKDMTMIKWTTKDYGIFYFIVNSIVETDTENVYKLYVNSNGAKYNMILDYPKEQLRLWYWNTEEQVDKMMQYSIDSRWSDSDIE